MNVYDKAHELARALKDSPEVVEYRRLTDKINANANNKKIVDDFRVKQIELYNLQVQGQEPSKEQMEAINSLYGVMSMNPEIREFLEAEIKFSRLWEDVTKIIGEAVGLDAMIGR